MILRLLLLVLLRLPPLLLLVVVVPAPGCVVDSPIDKSFVHEGTAHLYLPRPHVSALFHLSTPPSLPPPSLTTFSPSPSSTACLSIRRLCLRKPLNFSETHEFQRPDQAPGYYHYCYCCCCCCCCCCYHHKAERQPSTQHLPRSCWQWLPWQKSTGHTVGCRYGKETKSFEACLEYTAERVPRQGKPANISKGEYGAGCALSLAYRDISYQRNAHDTAFRDRETSSKAHWLHQSLLKE
jgi:hypothetical protein